MNKIILFFIALVLPIVSFAGKSWTLIFSAPYTIEKSCYDNLQVIDMRTYKDDLGFVKRGNARSRVALVTTNPLSDELSAYFFNALPERPKEKKELVLVLHDFWVEDDPKFYSVSTVHFDGDFYCNDNGQYIFLSRLDTLTENFHSHEYYTGGGRQDLAINRTVQAFICTVFSKYAVTLPRPGITHVSKSQIIQRRADERSRYPIFHTDTFRKGIYYSIDQFMNVKPVDTAIKIVPYEGAKNSATSYKIYYASDDGKLAVPLEKGSYFAVYDGKMWFAGQTDVTDMRTA